VLVGVVLAVSGFSKWMNLTWFAQTLLKYKMLPRAAVKILALLLPAVEVVLGLLVILKRQWLWPGYAAVLLFIFFSIAVVVNLVRGRTQLPCGCSGFRKKAKIGWRAIARNAGLCGLAYLSTRAQVPTDQSAYLISVAISVVLIASAFVPMGSCGKKRHAVLIPADQIH